MVCACVLVLTGISSSMIHIDDASRKRTAREIHEACEREQEKLKQTLSQIKVHATRCIHIYQSDTNT